MGAPWKETAGYGFHSTCLQVKDSRESVLFYQEVLGLDIINETEFPGLTMTYLGFKRKHHSEDFGTREALLHLMHVHGTEDDPNFKVQSSSTSSFRHLCISVPDIDKARDRMESLGVEIVEDLPHAALKKYTVVIADPDGYHIQLLPQDIEHRIALARACQDMMTPEGPSLESLGFRHAEGAHKLPDADHEPVDPRVQARGGSPDLEHPHWSNGSSASSKSSGTLPAQSAIAGAVAGAVSSPEQGAR